MECNHCKAPLGVDPVRQYFAHDHHRANCVFLFGTLKDQENFYKKYAPQFVKMYPKAEFSFQKLFKEYFEVENVFEKQPETSGKEVSKNLEKSKKDPEVSKEAIEEMEYDIPEVIPKYIT